MPQLRNFLSIKSCIIQFFMFVLSYKHYIYLFSTIFISVFQDLSFRNPVFFTYFILNNYFLQVTDIHGVDVTPRPLYHPDPYTGTAKPNKLLTSQEGSRTSDFIASYSLYQNTINPSTLGQFTRQCILFYDSFFISYVFSFKLHICNLDVSCPQSPSSVLSSQCATSVFLSCFNQMQSLHVKCSPTLTPKHL